MAIPCPGSENVDIELAVSKPGPDALSALIVALVELGRLIDGATECEGDCEAVLGDPSWTLRRFALDQQPDRSWRCDIATRYQVEVACVKPEPAAKAAKAPAEE